MTLTLDGLSLTYQGNKQALNNISLSAQSGILGLLGPNGAGKSSLMRILATLAKPTSGEVTWQGTNILQSPNVLRSELGYLPQYFGVYDQLSAREFLHYLAGLKEISHEVATARIDDLLTSFNLIDVADIKLENYSGGMRQRVGIAQALLNNPKLLIIDEPTVGLDPEERSSFRQLLSDMSSHCLIILSTHIVSDIETICDNIAIMNQGNLVTLQTPDKLIQSVSEQCWEITVAQSQAKQWQSTLMVSHSIRQGSNITFHYVSPPNQQPQPPQAKRRQATLEDAYLYYVKVRESDNHMAISDSLEAV